MNLPLDAIVTIEVVDSDETFEDWLSRRRKDAEAIGALSILYRGHREIDWTLEPTLTRATRGKDAGYVRKIEDRLLRSFRSEYGRQRNLGSSMPSAEVLQAPPDEGCMSVMQHYGIPTRLLDWAYNGYAAGFFACHGPTTTDSAIWYLNRELLSHQPNPTENVHSVHGISVLALPAEPYTLRLYGDLYRHPRVQAQEGVFTVCSDPTLDHAHCFVGMAKQAQAVDAKFVLGRTTITKEYRKQLRRLLASKGSRPDIIYPDMQGIAQYLTDELSEWVA